MSDASYHDIGDDNDDPQDVMNSESGVSCCRHPLGDGVVTVCVRHRYPEVSVLESATGSGGTAPWERTRVSSQPDLVATVELIMS